MCAALGVVRRTHGLSQDLNDNGTCPQTETVTDTRDDGIELTQADIMPRDGIDNWPETNMESQILITPPLTDNSGAAPVIDVKDQWQPFSMDS